MNSTNPSHEVPVNVSTDATDAYEETEHSRPPAPTSTPTVTGSAEHRTIYICTTRRQADTRLHTRSEPGCKLDSSNVIEAESQKGSPSKRLRTTFTQHQIALLEKKYALNSKPSRESRLEIAQELHLDGHVIANWFQNRRSRDVANKNAAVGPDTVVEAENKEAASLSDGAGTERKCMPVTALAPAVAKPRPVIRPAASRPAQPPPFMQSHFSVPMHPRDVLYSGLMHDKRVVPPQFAGISPLPAHQAGPTMQVSFLDDFSTGPMQQQHWGMQVELKSSDPNLPNLLGPGILHGAKKGIKPITPEAVVFPPILLHLPHGRPLRVLGPIPSPGLPPYRPIPTFNVLPPDERPNPNPVPIVPQPPTPSPPPSVPESPVECPSLTISPKNPPFLVSKTTRAEVPPSQPKQVPSIRCRRRPSRAMSLEYYASMMEKNRSPRKKTASAPGASPKEVHRTPVKSKEDAPLWASMVSSPPSPPSHAIHKAGIERLEPLVKSGRKKSLEFACALARVRSSDLKNACSAPESVGVKRKRLEDLLLEPRGRKVKKIRRTFSSGVKETHKETHGLRKAASIASIPLSQAETKEKEMRRPTREPNIPLSESPFIFNATALTTSDDGPCIPTLNPNPRSPVELRVTDWGANARDKENRKPEAAVKDLERNAVQVLASMMATRV